ncbi:hypothetical protein GCM10028804_08990 [Larkinella terrae]
MFYNIPFNYYIGLTEASVISIILCFVFLFLYYLSRIRNKFYISITAGGILINILLGINYFFNAGVIGSSLLLFILIYSLLSITSPRRQQLFWFMLNLVVVFSVLIIEYNYPESVVGNYSSRSNQITDVASTYLVGIILIYLAAYFFRKAYKAEQQLVEEKSVVLEQLNAEKNKLFSIISHDLRSPLASVQHYLQILGETDGDDLQKKKIESELLFVVGNTQEMLNNLLAWSTSQMVGKKAILSSVSVSSILKPVLEIYKPLAVKKSIQLTHSIDESLCVLADSNMLELIVRNLLGNAIKFTPLGGSIRVETVLFKTDVQIVIKDNGDGISDEDKSYIFSLKSRSTYGTDNEKGVGLGLFLCQEYAEEQNGKLWFESEQGIGTSFYLSLPIAVF